MTRLSVLGLGALLLAVLLVLTLSRSSSAYPSIPREANSVRVGVLPVTSLQPLDQDVVRVAVSYEVLIHHAFDAFFAAEVVSPTAVRDALQGTDLTGGPGQAEMRIVADRLGLDFVVAPTLRLEQERIVASGVWFSAPADRIVGTVSREFSVVGLIDPLEETARQLAWLPTRATDEEGPLLSRDSAREQQLGERSFCSSTRDLLRYAEAELATFRSDWTLAIDRLEQVTDAAPNFLGALLSLAEAHLERAIATQPAVRADLETAQGYLVPYLSATAADDPQTRDLYRLLWIAARIDLALAEVEMSGGREGEALARYEAARDYLDRLLQIRPSYLPAWELWLLDVAPEILSLRAAEGADVAAEREAWVDAATRLSVAFPSQVRAQLVAGRVLLLAGESGAAFERLQVVADASDEAALALAEGLIERDRFEGAESVLRSLVDRSPELAGAHALWFDLLLQSSFDRLDRNANGAVDRTELDESLREEFGEEFDDADLDRSNSLDRDEWLAALPALGTGPNRYLTADRQPVTFGDQLWHAALSCAATTEGPTLPRAVSAFLSSGIAQTKLVEIRQSYDRYLEVQQPGRSVTDPQLIPYWLASWELWRRTSEEERDPAFVAEQTARRQSQLRRAGFAGVTVVADDEGDGLRNRFAPRLADLPASLRFADDGIGG